MKSISMKAGTSQVYTNHCLRATSVTILNEAGFEAREICLDTSIKFKSYAHTVLIKKKRMSTATRSSTITPYCGDSTIGYDDERN